MTFIVRPLSCNYYHSFQIAFCFNKVPNVHQSSEGYVILHGIVHLCWRYGGKYFIHSMWQSL